MQGTDKGMNSTLSMTELEDRVQRIFLRAGMNAMQAGPLARVISACCEGIYLYVFIRLWVFRGVPEPEEQSQ